MRFLLLFLLAFPVHAQVVGWADCKHTRTDESLVSVRVALMTGRDEYSYRTLTGAKRISQVVEFTKTTKEVLLSGMRIDCTFTAPGVKSTEGRGTVYWLEPIKVSVGIVPKLGVTLVETSPGLWRAYIGKAP